MRPPKILVISPSSPRFDQTLHYYHAEFASVVQYLKTRLPQAEITALPAGLRGSPERYVVKELLLEPSFVLLWSRVWEAPAAKRVAQLAREICPGARVLVWGDGPLFMPHYFRREPFDGFVAKGDPELALADGIAAYLNHGRPTHGFSYRTSDGWRDVKNFRWLGGEHWPFPDLSVIPFEDYGFAREQRDKTTNDLSFDVTRGCQVGCLWCVDPLKGGDRDRRRPVKDTVRFMRSSLGRYDLFQLHGPVFTWTRNWVDAFVAEILRTGDPIPFKAVTLARHLTDEALVAALASAGMRSIGFGIETLTATPGKQLTPKLPAKYGLDLIAKNLRSHGIEGKAYTQVGLAGQKREDVLYTHARLQDLGFTIRPTGATPFHLLRGKSVEELEALDLSAWDRKSYYSPHCGLSRKEFFQLLIDPAEFRPAACHSLPLEAA